MTRKGISQRNLNKSKKSYGVSSRKFSRCNSSGGFSQSSADQPLLQRQSSDDDDNSSISYSASEYKMETVIDAKRQSSSESRIITKGNPNAAKAVNMNVPKNNTSQQQLVTSSLTSSSISSSNSQQQQQQQQQQLQLQEQHPESLTKKGKTKSSTAPTTTATPNQVMFYDPVVIVELSSSLCQGYITLLSGGSAASSSTNSNEKKSLKHPKPIIQEANIELAMAALLDGNVIDVCFGQKAQRQQQQIIAHNSTSLSTPLTPQQRIQMAKQYIDTLMNDITTNENDTTDDIEMKIVQLYCTAFTTIVRRNNHLKRCTSNIFAKCLFNTKKHRQETIDQLQQLQLEFFLSMQ